MIRPLVNKAVDLIVVLVLVSFAVFALVELLPGDPAVAILGGGRPPEAYEDVRVQLGLDDPMLVRYWDWLTSALSGDLGTSLLPPNTPVAERLGAAFPVSLEIAVLGLALALLFAVPLAVISVRYEGGLVDRLITGMSFALLSLPGFLAGLILIVVFANGLGWFPRAEWVRWSDSIPGNLSHAFLPALTVALMEMAMFVRILRNDLSVTLREDHILASRAKGLSPTRVLVFDALRPSSFSLITILGLSLGRLIGNTVIVEYLFVLPGMGSLIVSSATQGDLPMVQGAVLVIAVFYVICNSIIDGSYAYLDPRIRRANL